MAYTYIDPDKNELKFGIQHIRSRQACSGRKTRSTDAFSGKSPRYSGRQILLEHEVHV